MLTGGSKTVVGFATAGPVTPTQPSTGDQEGSAKLHAAAPAATTEFDPVPAKDPSRLN